jgi:cytochrome c
LKRKMVVVIVLAATLGLARVHPFGNPRTAPHKGLNSLLQGSEITANAKKVLRTKCADCHSNETRWPFYARIAPGSWLIERDVTQARAKMNLSDWDEMSADTKDVVIAKIAREAKEGDMPPLQYRPFHWESRLTPSDVTALSSMREASVESSLAQPGPGIPGDAARGKLAFQRRCTGCHTLEGDREGPRLAGVFGRRAGSVPGFEYSESLRSSGLTWNDATLERWLTDPDLIAADTKMDFHVPKAQERADLIAYLKQ